MNERRVHVTGKNELERVWNYIAWVNERDGYYNPDELITLSIDNGFLLDNPFVKIRKGTRIMEGASIKNNSFIDGERVTIGKSTVLDEAKIIGNNVFFGENNVISGSIKICNLRVGNNNFIKSIHGKSEHGEIIIGDKNTISDIVVNNDGGNSIRIGSSNRLHAGLTLNIPFDLGNIFIGSNNDLGNGGGGVISTAFRYAKGWGGHVVIGNNVEITRGAEVGGLSVVGWDEKALKEWENLKINLITLFTQGETSDLLNFLDRLPRDFPMSTEAKPQKVGLYGVVKVKRSFIAGSSRLRDDVRLHSSLVKNVEIRERCKVFFSSICSENSIIDINVNDRAIENQNINENVEWGNYPKDLMHDDYLPADYGFYERH